MVTICTTSLTFSGFTFCPHCVFVCSWEQTAIISLYNINCLDLRGISETECFYSRYGLGFIYHSGLPKSLKFQNSAILNFCRRITQSGKASRRILTNKIWHHCTSRYGTHKIKRCSLWLLLAGCSGCCHWCEQLDKARSAALRGEGVQGD